jgi:hypothetical protein
MVGVPGRSKACNTCKQRKIAVRRHPHVALPTIPVAQNANALSTVSVLSKGPYVHNASSHSGRAPGTNASAYLLRIMAQLRKVCRPPHRGLFAPRMLDNLPRLGRSMTRYH